MTADLVGDSSLHNLHNDNYSYLIKNINKFKHFILWYRCDNIAINANLSPNVHLMGDKDSDKTAADV